jgi:hypothetical protein
MKDYYWKTFRQDLKSFMGDSPVPYFGHAWAQQCRAQLSRVPADNLPRFLICLYFTVLVDQAMYTHFWLHYSTFQGLTQYPKFCMGLSQFQLNPQAILSVPVEQGVLRAAELNVLLPDGMTLFVDETIEFLAGHIPSIEPQDFFEKLRYDRDVQVPTLITMLNPSMKNDVVCVAYDKLTAAIKRGLPGASV